MITEAEEGVVHGIVQSVWDGDTRESLLSASFLGVHLMRYDTGQWTRTRLVVAGAWTPHVIDGSITDGHTIDRQRVTQAC